MWDSGDPNQTPMLQTGGSLLSHLSSHHFMEFCMNYMVWKCEFRERHLLRAVPIVEMLLHSYLGLGPYFRSLDFIFLIREIEMKLYFKEL